MVRSALIAGVLVVVLVLGLTAIDSYEERTCVEAGRSTEQSKSLRRSEHQRGAVPDYCDGFLPW